MKTHDIRSADVQLLVDEIHRRVGTDWAKWPGGWPGEVEVALIDAVLSIRARYGSPDTGVRGAIGRYRNHSGRSGHLDDLSALAATDPAELAATLHNRQKVSGTFKADLIVLAAQGLLASGVDHAEDVHGDSADQRRAYTRIHGLGPVTWEYFTMLLGHPGVKADTWIVRFVQQAIGRSASAGEAAALVKAAAAQLEKESSHLDHAIWSVARRSG
ncbi:hypothetical protein [Nakamurella endophytica]|uniref:Heme peroxidase n=1 Tax=Nakamurella endophytica TaxID=1748367 RepID=A0A917WFH0_9ACTN|nr:hypothetical protein [Nakamurella endophytica]GGL98834.1 hypothetical protein GCM10011594_18440 [Nakamurella endophytica]